MNINEKNEYEVINLGYEYPGMTGGVKWAVVTDFDQATLMEKYGKELSSYAPFVLMTMDQGEVFRKYDRNENKHDMRSIRYHDLFGYEEGLTEYYHSVFSNDEPEDAVIARAEREKMREALDKLPPVQRRRCILYFYHGLDEKEIDKAEGVTQQMVSKSLDQAMKNLKGILKL